MTPEQSNAVREVELRRGYIERQMVEGRPIDNGTLAHLIQAVDDLKCCHAAAVEETVETCAAVCERAAERLRREPEAWSGQNAELLQYAAAAIRREVGSTGDTQ